MAVQSFIYVRFVLIIRLYHKYGMGSLFLRDEFHRRFVTQFVHSLITTMYFGKTAEQIEMPFGVVGWVGTRNDMLDGGPV